MPLITAGKATGTQFWSQQPDGAYLFFCSNQIDFEQKATSAASDVVTQTVTIAANIPSGALIQNKVVQLSLSSVYNQYIANDATWKVEFNKLVFDSASGELKLTFTTTTADADGYMRGISYGVVARMTGPFGANEEDKEFCGFGLHDLQTYGRKGTLSPTHAITRKCFGPHQRKAVASR